MKCPQCQSQVEHTRAEDGATIHYCVDSACDWQVTDSNQPFWPKDSDELPPIEITDE